MFSLERLRPRYWAAWSTLLGFALVAMLPYRVLVPLGRLIGRALYLASPHRRETARINLGLCFPDKTDAERERLLSAHFGSLGMAVCETAMAFFWSDRRLAPLVRLEGLEHLQAELARGKGVILLTCHMTHLEVSGHLLALHQTISLMYRAHKNPLMDEVIRASRSARAHDTVERSDVRAMIRELKRGHAVWYAPDQNYGGTSQVAFVPFFGVPALTVTTTGRLARMTGAAVVPFFPVRLPGGAGYRIRVLPALEGFPSGDDVADTRRVTALVEDAVLAAPEQYLWVHRRFKTRPPGENRVYPRSPPKPRGKRRVT
ncbi:MAG: LpxL/LpxP family Kdo(2)-lipid IV(A) lauroyl/palmitoleoyl acyltransferase [Rhodocyclaceae bacterium]|nr:LpxL/LpxP family Kdo(2)-lipid IV(A) lauroyl/palmitoleoyl acyltransferase [Rhodocyclaceae bacterium]